jgi:arylsulfatase A-like enzyme
MIPATDALVFLGSSLALGILARFFPESGQWLGLRLLGFLAALALLLTVHGMHLVASLSLAAAVSHLFARIATAHDRIFHRFLRKSFPFLVLGEVGLAAAGSVPLMVVDRESQVSGAAAPDRARPNVLLIVLDTVRAESLSLHGYDRDTTPNLVRLARRGVRFEQARSTAPWTFPSHASLFTGRWPHELNVGEHRPLDSTYPTLAEFLAARGYRTGGFVANTYFCNSWYGLARGFDRYEDFYDDDVAVSWTETFRCTAIGQRLLTALGTSTGDHRSRKDAARINQDFLDWLPQRDGQPFFAFLNYFDAHTPYILPDGEHGRLGLPAPTTEELELLRNWESRPKLDVSSQEIRLIRDAYDDCIAYLDDQLGRLVDELERRGAMENTLVILTADHGEELGEHGLFSHGKSLYGQETHVPLLVLPPGESLVRKTVPEPVSLRDIPATILDVLGTGRTSPFPGASLAGHWRASSTSEPPRTSPAFSEVALRTTISHNPKRAPAWRGPMQSIVVRDRAYIRNADGREELYDLRADPGEEHDLATRNDERAAIGRFRRILRAEKP